MNKTFSVSSLLCFFFLLAAFNRAAAEDLKTLSGRNYRNITIRAITESGITMRFTQNFRGCIQF